MIAIRRDWRSRGLLTTIEQDFREGERWKPLVRIPEPDIVSNIGDVADAAIIWICDLNPKIP